MGRRKNNQRPTEPLTETFLVEKLVPGGQGLGTLASGQKVFVWGALPGESVTSLRITQRKKNYLEGIAEQVINPSARRIPPRDDCYLSTSPWQILDYGYELSSKAELLREQFRQFGLDLPFDGQVGTDGVEFGYRNKMEYALFFDKTDEKIYPAFRHRGTHCKFPVHQSSLERPEIWAESQKMIAELNANGEEARKYQTLLLRCNQQGQVSGGLLENGKSHPQFEALRDSLLGYEYSYSPNGFFQINLPVYEMALREIAEHLGDGPVLDLYAGVGTIGLSVARERELTLVELNGSAYREMERNCAGTTAKPVLSASEEALAYLKPDQTVIVDPPRAGLDDKLVQKILEVQPETLIYLSCNPATQARDAQKLVDAYQLDYCRPFNFFPRTPHLENLIVFKRLK